MGSVGFLVAVCLVAGHDAPVYILVRQSSVPSPRRGKVVPDLKVDQSQTEVAKIDMGKDGKLLLDELLGGFVYEGDVDHTKKLLVDLVAKAKELLPIHAGDGCGLLEQRLLAEEKKH